MTSPADVTVVIPHYNGADTVSDAIASVLAQSLPPRRVIVVDDASTPDQRAGLAALTEPLPTVDVLWQPVNRGPGAARNRGWDAADTAYVAFLDADDTWAPGKLALQASWMAEHPQCPLSAHAVAAPDGTDRRQRPSATRPRWWSASQLLWRNPVATSTVMVRRELPHRFEERMRASEDYRLWLDVAHDAAIAVHPEALATRPGGARAATGLSSALVRMERGELSNYSRERSLGRIGTLRWVVVSLVSLQRFGVRAARVRLHARAARRRR